LCGIGQAFAEVAAGRFSAGDLQGWETKAFSGQTQYTLTSDDGRRVLSARSESSASGLVRNIDVDLRKTPYLTWHWKVDNLIKKGADERVKQGDDYPARVYVIVSGGFAFWNTRSINYVWSSSQPVETVWPNAFTDRNLMVAVQSGTENLGRWVVQKRNVREDFKRYLGIEVDEINAVAIMTDTDQTGSTVTGSYGDITFGEH
jgi:hypothetical protein